MRRLISLCLGLCLLACGCADDSAPPTYPDSGPPRFVREIASSEFLDCRILRLDLPPREGAGYLQPEMPGREEGLVIDPASVRVYRPATLAESESWGTLAAALPDSTGRWGRSDGGLDLDAVPRDAWVGEGMWRLQHTSHLVDAEGRFKAIDLGYDWGPDVVLAVAYQLIDATTGEPAYTVGDRPGIDPPGLYGADGQDHHRLKLIHASPADEFTYQYARHNVYDMRQRFIDPRWFEIRILAHDASREDPSVDEMQTPYTRIFGLTGGYLVDDFLEPRVDLQRGLILFPDHMERPFAAGYLDYRENAGVYDLAWDDSFLARNLVPDLYDWRTPPSARPAYARFTIEVTMAREVY